MDLLRRRAFWFAGALAILAAGSIGSAIAMRDAASTSSARSAVHATTVDHDAGAPARAQTDRMPSLLRLDGGLPGLLAWLGLVLAALLARAVGRAMQVRTLRWIPAPPCRRAHVRGPPASFALT